MKDELARIGYIGEQVPGEFAIGAYSEIHIEQGPVLAVARAAQKPGYSKMPV